MQTEGADAELVLPAGNAERRFELVLLANAKLHISHGKIELSEEARTARLVDELVHVGERLHRPLRDGVKPAVVLAEAPRTIRFAREDDRGCVRGARRHDPALVEQEGDLLAALVELALRPPLHRP